MTELVAIINITPDSFSNNGEHYKKNDALNYIKELIAKGCKHIDIGAESTRPNATEISEDCEWKRLENILPQISELCKDNNVKLSLDSRNYNTIIKSLDYGIDIINDVSGLSDMNILNILKDNPKLKLVLMHSLSVPADNNIIIDTNLDVITEINKWFDKKIEEIKKHNIDINRVIFDPGIGFNKTDEQSIDIINNLDKFKFKNEIYIGHSKKSFLKRLFDGDIQVKTNAITAYLINKKVNYIRVHDFIDSKTILDIYNKLLQCN